MIHNADHIAQTVVDLINSQPRTPSREELAAVIAKESAMWQDDNSLHGTGICYWEVKASGDWCHDCLVGEEYARMYLERVRHRSWR